MLGWIRDRHRFRKESRGCRKWEPTARPSRHDFERWRASLAPGRNSVDDELPWLTFTAIDFLERLLARGGRVFEWGSGGSTLFFSRRATQVVSVEHDPTWFERIAERLARRPELPWRGRLVMPQRVATTGSTDPADWSRCVSSAAEFEGHSFADYVGAIDADEGGFGAGAGPAESYDVVLVDGRARPACVARALSRLDEEGVLVLDNAERPHYGPVQRMLAEQGLTPRRFAGPTPYCRPFSLTTAWSRSRSRLAA